MIKILKEYNMKLSGPPIVKLVHCLAILFFLQLLMACNAVSNRKTTKHYNEADFERAEQIWDNQYKMEARRYIDSKYAEFPYVSIADSCRYYRLLTKINSYQHLNKMPDNDSAIFYAQSVIRLIEENRLEDDLRIDYMEALIDLGGLYRIKDRFTESFEAATKCRYIGGKNTPPCIMGYNSSLLGLYAYDQQDYRSAIKYFKEAIEGVAECEKDDRQFYVMQGTFSNLGSAYLKLNMYDSAMFYFSKAELFIEIYRTQYNKSTGFTYQAIAAVYANISSIYQSRGLQDSAEQYMNMALDQALTYLKFRDVDVTRSDRMQIPHIRMMLANLLISANKIAKAEALLNEVKPELPTFRPKYLYYWNESMYKLSAAKGDFEAALQYTYLYHAYKDSLDRGQRDIQKFDLAGAVDKLIHKQRAEELARSNKVQQLITLGVIIIVVLLGISTFTILQTMNRYKLLAAAMQSLNAQLTSKQEQLQQLMLEQGLAKEKEKQRELLMQEVQLRTYYHDAIANQRNQISEDMHDDLSSSLAALRFYMQDMQTRIASGNAQQILSDINQEMDGIYFRARDYMHNLKTNSFGSINLYEFLESLQAKFSSKTSLQLKLDVNRDELNRRLDMRKTTQLYYILQEAISNVIKHSNASELYISVKMEQDNCLFDIMDNGTGFDDAAILHGMGLQNIRKRIDNLAGIFQLNSGQSGTHLSGSFPLN